AAEAIARGDHIVDDTDGQTESQQPLTALFAPASERETVLAGVAAAKQKMQHCRDELNVAIETLVDAHVALTTPAPAVSRDDQALLADICDNMAEVLKPLPGIPDAPGSAGTRATESGEGDEA